MLERVDKLSSKNMGILLTIAITRIVFASTDDFDDTNNIDRRLPFRNHILHNGIHDYNDNEIDILYKILLSFILKIMQIKNRLDKTKNRN